MSSCSHRSLSQQASPSFPWLPTISCLAEKTWLHWSTEQPPWTCQRGVLDVGWQSGSPPRPLQASQGAVCRPSTCSHPAMLSMAPAWHMKSRSWCPHHSSSASTPSSQACLRYCTCLSQLLYLAAADQIPPQEIGSGVHWRIWCTRTYSRTVSFCVKQLHKVGVSITSLTAQTSIVLHLGI